MTTHPALIAIRTFCGDDIPDVIGDIIEPLHVKAALDGMAEDQLLAVMVIALRAFSHGHCTACLQSIMEGTSPMTDHNLPVIHPRHAIVARHRLALDKALGEWLLTTDELTHAEYLSILNDVMSGMIGRALKYAIREERHGNTDTPGDLES